MADIEKAPEMIEEGQRNLLKWLQSDPDPAEVKKDLPMLERITGLHVDGNAGFERNPETGHHNGAILAGFESLEPETQEKLRKIHEANEYLYKLALEIASSDQKKAYRTAAKAGEVIKDYPKAIATVTLPNYENAMNISQNGNAYLTPLPSTDGLQFKDGKMFFQGTIMPISEAQLKDMKTKESISSIDLPLLRSFYSILLSQTQKNQKKQGIVTLFVPDLAAYLGTTGKLGNDTINSIIAKVQKFHNIVGLVKTPYGDSIFPVLNFEGYDKDKNTISFSSPYMNYVIEKVYGDLSQRKDKNGKPKLKKNGEPLRIASHSYAIKSEIQKERNKNAVENVFIIVTTIEQAGGKGAHIAASTIVERNAQLKEALATSANPTQLLQRCFKKTWELLRTKTYLTEMYEGIELPDPKNPANIPTAKTLSKIVFNFPHKGKKKK